MGKKISLKIDHNVYFSTIENRRLGI